MNNESTTPWRIPPAKIPDSEIAEEYTADVVVAGLGHAGVPAIRAAAEAGASVIGFEKMPARLWWAWGQDIGHINSKFLASKGVPRVDTIEFFNEWMRRSGNRANPKLVMQFCQHAGEAFDWYLEVASEEKLARTKVAFWYPGGKDLKREIAGQKFWTGTVEFSEKGVFMSRFHPVQKTAGGEESDMTPYGMPRKTMEGVYTLTQLLWDNLEKARGMGARLFFGMSAQQLVMDGDRVTGVIARDVSGKYVKYKAQKGVILSTGDFGGNKEMCRDLLTDISDLFDEGEDFRFSGRDGRGIQMGVWAGGRMEARPVPSMGGNFIVPRSVVNNFGTLWVDDTGRRYCNEGFGDPVFCGMPVAAMKHRPTYVIFDSTIWADLKYGTLAHGAYRQGDEAYDKTLRDNMEAAGKAGPEGHTMGGMMGEVTRLYAADSLEKLADYMGFNGTVKQNFLMTVKRYNEFCQTKRDEEFGKDAVLLNAIDSPPYYGQPVKPGEGIGFFLCTVGGLLTDECQNVLNEKKDPIPGLFATGNCCGRRFGPQYSTPISGVSIGICLTLGREVGRIVAGVKT